MTAPLALVALVTCPVDRAEALARVLVEARVAACVNVVPRIVSTYRWKGEVLRDEESLLVIKTVAGGFQALRDAVLAHHPYEVPEVLAFDVAEGHAPYLDWIAASTGP